MPNNSDCMKPSCPCSLSQKRRLMHATHVPPFWQCAANPAASTCWRLEQCAADMCSLGLAGLQAKPGPHAYHAMCF